jgi:hypothetical protein
MAWHWRRIYIANFIWQRDNGFKAVFETRYKALRLYELALSLERLLIKKFRRINRDIFKSTPNLKDMTSPSSRRTSPNVPGEQHSTSVATTSSPTANAASPIGHVYHASAPPSGGPYSRYYDRSHSYNHPGHQAHHPFQQPKSVSPIIGDIRGRSGTDTENRARVRFQLLVFPKVRLHKRFCAAILSRDPV